VGQGFYFAAPLRPDALYPILRTNNMYASEK
jgi:hypothetical protein